MGTFRTSFIINEEGVIERILLPKQIKTQVHAAQILGEKIRTLLAADMLFHLMN